MGYFIRRFIYTFMTNMNSLSAFFMLLVLSPFLLVIMLLIIVFDGFPIFFLQKRLGLNKREFTIYKFRTMDDGKVTFLGRIFRRTGVDELPQLLNVVLGDINFIGPRPLTKQDVERLSWNTSYHNQRWLVKPGLTGLGQFSPVCNKKMSFYLDTYYVNNRSVGLDLKIIYVSFLTLFIGKNKTKKILFKR